MKLKDFISTAVCPKCGCKDYKKFTLWFILEDKKLKLIISCSECEEDFEVPELLKVVPVKNYMLSKEVGHGS